MSAVPCRGRALAATRQPEQSEAGRARYSIRPAEQRRRGRARAERHVGDHVSGRNGGISAMVPPDGSTIWLLPTVEMFTSARPDSIARSRAIASCC